MSDLASRYLSALYSALTGENGGVETMVQLPPEQRVNRDNMHEWGHVIADSIARNMARLMTMTNLPDFLAEPEDVQAVTVQVKCDQDANTFDVRGIVNNGLDPHTQDADTVLWSVHVELTPNKK